MDTAILEAHAYTVLIIFTIHVYLELTYVSREDLKATLKRSLRAVVTTLGSMFINSKQAFKWLRGKK